MRLSDWLAMICLVACASGVGTGAEGEGPTAQAGAVWAADDMTKIDRWGKPLVLSAIAGYREKNAAWDGSTGVVELFAAANEYVAFRVVVEGGTGGLAGVGLLASDLVGDESKVPAEGVEFFVEFYTQVEKPSKSPQYSMGPGMYPDGLIPMRIDGRGTFDVEAGMVQAAWVDVRVPPRTQAGIYKGRVEVTREGVNLRTLEVKLTVWDFELPAASHLRWRVGYNEPMAEQNGVEFDRRTGIVGDEFLALERKFYRMCRAHKVTPTTHYTTPIPDSTGKGAELEIDWASYDKRFGGYLDGSAFDDGLPVNIFSLPVNPQSYDGWPSSTRYRNRVDPESFRKALQLTIKHWDAKGWDLGNAFVYVADEPRGDRYGWIKQHCEVLKEVAPQVHRCVAFYKAFGVNGAKVVEEFKEYVNHWAIAGDYMQRGALDGLQERGDWVGIYQGSEPFEGGEALDMDGVALTTWPWIAWGYRLDTLFIYLGTAWNTDDIWTEGVNHGWGTNSQGVLFYPGLKWGVKEVLPSVRLKAMRRGMQDFEYMWMLREAGRGEEADAIVKGIIKAALDDAAVPDDGHYGPGKWERDPEKWLAARKALAAEIMRGGE